MELSLKSNLTNKCARIIVLWIKKKNGGKTLLRILGGVCVDKWHMSRNVCDGKKSSSETEPPPLQKTGDDLCQGNALSVWKQKQLRFLPSNMIPTMQYQR